MFSEQRSTQIESHRAYRSRTACLLVSAIAFVVTDPIGTSPATASSKKARPVTVQVDASRGATGMVARNQVAFVNPIAEGADPWIVRHNGRYIACLSEANRAIALYISDRLSAVGPKQVIWKATINTMCSAEVWAPELHFLDGRWYAYFAASDGQNRSHRMWVLQSAATDPLGPYSLGGPLYTGDNPATRADNCWAIDGTVFELAGRRYFVWSGWQDEHDDQCLYIAPMKDPLTMAGKRVRLCRNNDYLWERVDEKPATRGLLEGPEVLQHNGRTFLVYSCSGSWQPSYKLGLLELRTGGDPLRPADWIKHPEPVFQSNAKTFGVGHGSFVKSPDASEDWLIYHVKMDRADGWRRAIFIQPFQWMADGIPDFGTPVAAGTPLPLPSGETVRTITGPHRWDFKKPSDLAAFQYFGHHQLIDLADGRLHLGRMPKFGITLYRSGEKVVVTGGRWRDFTAVARVRVVAGGRDVGLLFRCTLPAVGYDAQNGYFAGIIPRDGKVVLGHMDGKHWRELALVNAEIHEGRNYELSVTTQGPEIAVRLDGREVIRTNDSQCSVGSIGLRVVDTHAAFAGLEIR